MMDATCPKCGGADFRVDEEATSFQATEIAHPLNRHSPAILFRPGMTFSVRMTCTRCDALLTTEMHTIAPGETWGAHDADTWRRDPMGPLADMVTIIRLRPA
jgi:hypothetical protein